MKFLFGIALMLIGLTAICQVKNENKDNTLIGKWIFEVSTAPTNFQKGEIVFNNKEGLKGAFMFSDGQIRESQSVDFKNDTLTMNAIVVNEQVCIVMVLKDGKLKGTVNSPEGEMPIVAERIIEDQSSR
ncbi:MAG: hypothetical protein Q8859_13345 [Bacteroidota bacterium]|nr:hypothetical protein [Bacteroidota bacterium]